MKNLLIVTAIIGILAASGSVSYYYAYFLPQRLTQIQEDISAIRAAVNPTPDQLQEQVKQLEALFGVPSNAAADFQKLLERRN
jgi:hypothetical protein